MIAAISAAAWIDSADAEGASFSELWLRWKAVVASATSALSVLSLEFECITYHINKNTHLCLLYIR
jgi:hypothetical protein